MTEREAFVAAIIADPTNDGPRLVYADWLEEHGESDRAEIIRVQCVMAKTLCLHTPYGMRCDQRHGHSSTWCDACTVYMVLACREYSLLDIAAANHWFAFPAHIVSKWWIRRGFVERVVVSSGQFGRHIDHLLANNPIREVVIDGAQITVSTNDLELHCDVSLSLPPYQFSYPISLRGDVELLQAGKNIRGTLSRMLADRWKGVAFEFSNAMIANWTNAEIGLMDGLNRHHVP